MLVPVSYAACSGRPSTAVMATTASPVATILAAASRGLAPMARRIPAPRARASAAYPSQRLP